MKTKQATAEQELDLDDYRRVRFYVARQAGLTRLEAARFAHGPVPRVRH